MDEADRHRSIERRLRAWAFRVGLPNSRAATWAYSTLNRIRYRGQWDRPVEFHGSKFKIGRDFSLYPSVRNGGFEEHELPILLSRVRPGQTVWDVGANIGIYSVLMAKIDPEVRVVSFEPVPETRRRLTENLVLNSVSNATVEALALSDNVGSAVMRVHDLGHGADHIIPAASPEVSSQPHIKISISTGDKYLETADRVAPSVIKVDVEGHEPAFLRGAWKLISDSRPHLMLEVSPHRMLGAHQDEWRVALEALFRLYGAALLFDASGGRRVTSIDVLDLKSPLYSLLLPAESP